VIGYTLVLAASTVPGSVASGVSTTGWWLGYAVGFLVLLVVLMLVIPILLLAHAIGKEATMINDSLTQAVHNTAPLAALQPGDDDGGVLDRGAERGRERLGG
jgi:K+-transporting ATPase A subunit